MVGHCFFSPLSSPTLASSQSAAIWTKRADWWEGDPDHSAPVGYSVYTFMVLRERRGTRIGEYAHIGNLLQSFYCLLTFLGTLLCFSSSSSLHMRSPLVPIISSCRIDIGHAEERWSTLHALYRPVKTRDRTRYSGNRVVWGALSHDRCPKKQKSPVKSSTRDGKRKRESVCERRQKEMKKRNKGAKDPGVLTAYILIFIYGTGTSLVPRVRRRRASRRHCTPSLVCKRPRPFPS